MNRKELIHKAQEWGFGQWGTHVKMAFCLAVSGKRTKLEAVVNDWVTGLNHYQACDIGQAT